MKLTGKQERKLRKAQRRKNRAEDKTIQREENKRKAEKSKIKRPTMRGWRGRGRGEAAIVQPFDEYRGSTRQVCGLWPFGVGTGTPMVGVPLGRHVSSGATLCCDPISWFTRANLINNPSVFVLGKPGLGKSTSVRRMATGLAGYGVLPLVLGDLKPDYVDMIEALGGQVIRLGRGSEGFLNVLDPGEASDAARRLREAGHEAAATKLLAEAHGRRHVMVCGLISIMRHDAPTDREETIIDRALKVLDARLPDRAPVLGDLLQVIQNPPAEVREVALDRGDDRRYKEITENLEATLIGLTSGGRLGETFSRPTTNPMRRDRPVVYDVSGLDEGDLDLQAATLLACWSAGFGTVAVAQRLADAGLEPRRHYFVIMDELWRALRAGRGMVDRVDALTRLNRQIGVGTAFLSHTMSDLLALPTEEDKMKAKGFVERAGMVICGGLPFSEFEELTKAVPMSQAEQALLAGWSDPPAWDSKNGREAEPPGRGKFLVKVGGRPGIPIKVMLTKTEMAINDTNKLWHDQSRIGAVDHAQTGEQFADEGEAAETAAALDLVEEYGDVDPEQLQEARQ